MGVRLLVRSAWTEEEGAASVAYEFDQARVVLGRGSGADVQLPHPAVSATHASLRVENTGYVLVDEGSTNGTRVNGTRLVPGRPKALRSGDRIELGGFDVEVRCSVPVSLPTSAERTAALARHLVRQALVGTEAVAPMRLTVTGGPDVDLCIELPPSPSAVVVGRGEEAQLRLTDPDCSRAHAAFERDLEGVTVRDLDSKNGVRVGGTAVSSRRLRHGESVRIGGSTLRFDEPAEQALQALRGVPDLETEPPSLGPVSPDEPTGPGAAPTSSDQSPGIAAQEPDARLGGRASPTTKPATRPTRPAADMIVYMLAGAVLALSATGLWLLLRSG